MAKFFFISLLSVLVVFSLAQTSLAQQNQVTEEGTLVPCGIKPNDPCEFSDFYQLIKNIIDFGLLYFAIPIATLSFAGAGLMLMISGDNESKRTTAKNMIWWALIGLVLAFAAWLIVDAILDALVDKDKNAFTIPLKEN